MPEIEEDFSEVTHYKAFVMNGEHMVPAVHNGDYVVADLSQRFIRSGDIYVVDYNNSVIVCRLLLDRNEVTLIFDGASHQIIETVDNVKIIGRVIEVKTLTQPNELH